LECVHFGSLPFRSLATELPSDHFRGNVAGVPVEPAAQRNIARQPVSLTGQVDKHRLGHILGQVRIAADQAHGG